MQDTIEIVRAVFQAKAAGHTEMPPKISVYPGDRDNFVHAMPAFIAAPPSLGMKWLSGFPENPKRHGLPYLTGLIILNDASTGVPLAVMDAAWITAQRAAAVSGISAQLLARPDSRILALLGTGVQARTQLQALALVLPHLEKVCLYNVNPVSLERFIADMQPFVRHIQMVKSSSPREAVTDADVVVTAGPRTRCPRSVISNGWLRTGVLGLPIDFESMWSGADLVVDRYYVDDLAQYRHYQSLGFFALAPEPVGDLGDLVGQRVAGRISSEERIIAMNLGVAIADVAVANEVYRRAGSEGIGTTVPI